MNLPDALLAEARARATIERRTVTSLVEEALRRLLHDDPPAERTYEPLPAFGKDSVMLVDINDEDALWARLDADGYR